jgi:small nuclear ribonucleoprotein F
MSRLVSSMSDEPINPIPFLNDLTGKTVSVKLKWGQELKGVLKAVDKYMNLEMVNTEEFESGNYQGALGEVFVRCNNILYVRELTDEIGTPEVVE